MWCNSNHSNKVRRVYKVKIIALTKIFLSVYENITNGTQIIVSFPNKVYSSQD